MKKILFILLALGLITCTKKAVEQTATRSSNETDQYGSKAAIDKLKRGENSIKFYDSPSQHFYLLTFYKTIEKNAGEDFSFVGASTFRQNENVQFDDQDKPIVLQYLALYFFKDGQVVYHAPYSFREVKGDYIPLGEALANLEALKKSKKHAKSILFGRIVDKIQTAVSKVNYQPANKRIDSVAAPRTDWMEGREIKLFLERFSPKSGQPASSIFLLGEFKPAQRGSSKRPGNREAILIKKIFYEKEISSAGAKHTEASIDNTFNFGNLKTNLDTNTASARFWFRLQSGKPQR